MDYLGLVVSRSYGCRFNRTVLNKKKKKKQFLIGYIPSLKADEKCPSLSLSLKEAALHILKASAQVMFLIEHTPRDSLLSPQSLKRPSVTAVTSPCSPSQSPCFQRLPRISDVHIWYPRFHSCHLQDAPLRCLPLMASGALVCRSHRTVANKETFLNQLLFWAPEKREQKKTPISQSFSERIILLFFKSHCLRICLLISLHSDTD